MLDFELNQSAIEIKNGKFRGLFVGFTAATVTHLQVYRTIPARQDESPSEDESSLESRNRERYTSRVVKNDFLWRISMV